MIESTGTVLDRPITSVVRAGEENNRLSLTAGTCWLSFESIRPYIAADDALRAPIRRRLPPLDL